MAINTALLGGLLFGILQIDICIQLPQIVFPGVLIVILGIGMVYILRSLILWLRRVNSSIRLCYDRMREIETELGMWRGWLIHGLDNFDPERGFDDKQIPSDDQKRLLLYHPTEWWKNKKISPHYEPPRGLDMVRNIFLTFIVIWMILVLSTVVILLMVFYDLMFVILGGILSLVGLGLLYYFLIMRSVFKKPKKCETQKE